MQNDRTVEEMYNELGIIPPESIKHLTEEELRDRLKIDAHHSWRQSGTFLHCTCEIGSHSSQVPPTHILRGTDAEGKPILDEIVI